MTALSDLTDETSKVLVSIDAAIVVIGNQSNDSTQLAALTKQLSDAQAKLDAAVAAATPPAA